MKLVFCKVGLTHVLEGLLFLLEPLVCGHQLLLGLIEVVLKLLHLFLKFTDLLLSLYTQIIISSEVGEAGSAASARQRLISWPHSLCYAFMSGIFDTVT